MMLHRALAVLITVLALGFVAVSGLRVLHPESISPDRAEAAAAQDRDQEITGAARQATLAFLSLDYRDMAPRLKAVLDVSTGQFKEEFARSQDELVAKARRGQTIASGVVRYIGISASREASAVVVVAADQSVTNLAIQEADKTAEDLDDQRRIHRFKLTLERVGDRWLIANLESVS